MENSSLKIILGIAIGATTAFAIAYFGKSIIGVNILTRNPLVSAIVGGLGGYLITVDK